MNIPKAIEILTTFPIILKTAEDHDRFDAIKLGTEALKVVKEYRQRGILNLILLPGETKD
ncbi:hypothetical protein ES703_71491 [subsurface metagenome]